MMNMQSAQLLERAASALSSGQWDETVALCRRVLASDSNNLQAHLLWASALLPGDIYFTILDRIHRHLRPRTYVEIGVDSGRSLVLAQPGTTCIGIDPRPQLTYPVPNLARVYVKTSDAFFAQHDLFSELGGRPVDLAFLDGMHLFAFVLRDFINIERHCTPTSTCLVHDCCPLDERTAALQRTTTFWSGDVWKLILCLKKYRPDLEIHTVATAPTGLAIIRGLDPGSTVLRDRLDRICEEFAALPYAVLQDDKKAKLNIVPNDWPTIQSLLGPTSA
jgi:hypothetical protein